MWLDRGELDKIIERSESASPSSEEFQPSPGYAHRGSDDDRSRRKKSILKDLLDF